MVEESELSGSRRRMTGKPRPLTREVWWHSSVGLRIEQLTMHLDVVSPPPENVRLLP